MQTEYYDLLLVDDDEDDAIIIRGMLSEIQRAKFRTQWAPTYEAGLDHLRSYRWSAALVDYDLGAHNGLDLIREATAHQIKVPMIMVTGRGRYEVDLDAMQAGAADYVSKNQLNSALLEHTLRYAMQRRRIEEELERRVAERTRQLQLLLNQTPAILWSTDKNLVLTMLQGRGLAPLGISPNQLVGKTVQSALRELFLDGNPEIEDAHQRARAGESMQFEVELAGVYLSGYVESILDQRSGITGCIGTAFDITDRKRAEEALYASAALFEGLFTVAPDATLLVLNDGTIQRANQQTEHVFSYEAAELTGQPVEQLLPERFREAHVRHRAGYLATPHRRPMGLGLNLFGLHKDGHEFPVDVTLSPLNLGPQRYIICLVRDLTRQ